MRSAHRVDQVRAAEVRLLAALPDGALMARAASGLATAIIDFLGGARGRRIVLLVGSGDNGGDALFAGALLARRGAGVTAVLLSPDAHPAGLAALHRAGGTSCPAADFSARGTVDLVVDGIVGIGGRPGLRPDAVALLAELEGVPVVAVDVPSGVGVDSGELAGAHVTADLTVTFGTHKPCHLIDPAAAHCGVVTLVDIGLDLPTADVGALGTTDVSRLLPVPSHHSHKYTRGVVGLRTGGGYPGAGLLSTAGASSGLAGMVRYVGPDGLTDQVRAAHPEVVAGGGRVNAWVVGCGSGDEAGRELDEALADGVPVVVDADALVHVRPGMPRLILTPHAGELARMLDVERDEIESRPLHWVREAAAHFDAVVLLKGRRTLIARPGSSSAPGPHVWVNTTGTPWLATAGAGDVLAGLIGSIVASGDQVGLGLHDAAALGAWLHGAAATLASGGGPITAGDVAAAIGDAVRRVVTG
ncbi:hydroxyethylthiazole kinase-like uncharacterized protein yjeF [Nocardioides daedukensis]|uniref:Bifunctional NAD(P)H-hydrate repair enzyme n=1 Tax=Nocardioides daedukensis TaxID=634462 RepID=A0A7Y9UPZ0_9ACTN|nr:NAD(P)H-hydrate epimerase [Nocardioides daedukensis]NYG60118.1 hydroxyethylthiazole kinase-like uncharacterized protein yjeF [Nocardioides daedukensis]